MGGRITESGRLGAFITKVKKGSLADVVGHLRAGRQNQLIYRYMLIYKHTHTHIYIGEITNSKKAHFLPGDEVLQWNGKLLPGATMKEVYDIILESQAEPQVELVVSRPIG